MIRTQETRFAEWDEFEDLDGPNPIWRIPPERMKMRSEHLVPLPRQALELRLEINDINVYRKAGNVKLGRFLFPVAYTKSKVIRTIGCSISCMAERAAAVRAERDRVRLAAETRRLAAETEKRAELFVAAWKKQSAHAKEAPTYAARDAARANLADMAKSLHRDPQLESLLQNRRAQLGLDATSTKTLSQDLQLSLGRGRGMGIGM